MNFLKFALTGWPARILIALMVIAVAPILFLVAALSFVGIPIAFLLFFVPAAAMLYIAQELLHQFAIRHFLPGNLGRIVSVAAPVVAMFVVATLANARIDGEVAKLVAGDRDELSNTPVRSLALVEGNAWRRDDESACGGLCQRLLLTGAVGEVFVATSAEGADAIDPNAPARAYRWRRGGACEAKKVPNSARENGDAIAPDEAVRLRIAAGECLDEQNVRVGAADAILLSNNPARRTNAYSARLDAFADATGADRLAYFVRRNETFVEEYRRTMVLAMRHPPVAFPAIVEGPQLHVAVGFLRLAKRVNREKYQDLDLARAQFLSGRLGMRISLADSVAPDRVAAIDAILKGRAPDVTTTRGLIDDFLSAPPRANEPGARAYAERVIAIIEDNTLELPYSIATGVAQIAQHHKDLATRAADALLARIKAAEPGARQSRYNDSLIRIAVRALSILPDETIALRSGDIVALIDDAERRGDAAQLFERLSVLKADGVAPLLNVIDAAREDSALATAAGDDRWRDLFEAGLKGLCKTGAREAAAPLAARLRATDDFRQYHWALGIETLIALGAPPAEVRALYSRDMDPDWLERVDTTIARAQERQSCD